MSWRVEMATMSLSLITMAPMWSPTLGRGIADRLQTVTKLITILLTCLNFTRTKMNYMPIFWMMVFWISQLVTSRIIRRWRMARLLKFRGSQLRIFGLKRRTFHALPLAHSSKPLMVRNQWINYAKVIWFGPKTLVINLFVGFRIGHFQMMRCAKMKISDPSALPRVPWGLECRIETWLCHNNIEFWWTQKLRSAWQARLRF